MKAILEFNLPEEQEEFETASNGYRFKSVLWELDQNVLRACTKYGTSIVSSGAASSEEVQMAEKFREMLHELSANNGVSLFD